MAAGGALGQLGAPPCYSFLWETLHLFKISSQLKYCYLLVLGVRSPTVQQVATIMKLEMPPKYDGMYTK